jgi:hypothetical protein
MRSCCGGTAQTLPNRCTETASTTHNLAETGVHLEYHTGLGLAHLQRTPTLAFRGTPLDTIVTQRVGETLSIKSGFVLPSARTDGTHF